jgi:hypothetical protein
MWVFCNDAFVSIVDNNEFPDHLTVRARFKEHIKNLFPEAVVVSLEKRDYQYRAYIRRERVAQVMFEKVMAIDYVNFKDSITDPVYHAGCADVWSAMYDASLNKADPSRRSNFLEWYSKKLILQH